MVMIEEVTHHSSFDGVLERIGLLEGREENKRTARLCSAAKALIETHDEGVVLTAATFYSSQIAALEGTLHQQGDREGSSTIVESMWTQLALLDMFILTLPHVKGAILKATLTPTSRVLRGVVAACRKPASDSEDELMTDLYHGEENELLDSIRSVLCTVCKAVGLLLQHAVDDKNVDSAVVQKLLKGTLFTLLHDTRAKVKKTAQIELGLLLLHEKNVSGTTTIRALTNTYIVDLLKTSAPEQQQAKSTKKSRRNQETLSSILEFLLSHIGTLDFVTIGTSLMKSLLALFADCAAESGSATMSDFVVNAKNSQRDLTSQVKTINEILSVIVALVAKEDSDIETDENDGTKLDHFAARTLASLVQTQSPELIFQFGTTNSDVALLATGCKQFGQLLLASVQRLLLQSGRSSDENVKTACKLFPLGIRTILGICRLPWSQYDEDMVGTVVEPLLSELSRLFRSHLYPIKTQYPSEHDECCRSGLTALRVVLHDASYRTTWGQSLNAIALLLQQTTVNTANESRILVSTYINAILSLKEHLSTSGDENDESHAIDGAVSTLIQGMGLETFWNAVNVTNLVASKTEDGSSQERSVLLPWLFNKMKVSGAFSENPDLRLSFFLQKVLPVARSLDANSVNLPNLQDYYQSMVVDLWAFFPSLCRRPMDLPESLPSLEGVLVRAVHDKRYPQLLGHICSGIIVLVNGVRERSFDQGSSASHVVGGDASVSNDEDVRVIGDMSLNMMPALFKLADGLYIASDGAKSLSQVQIVADAVSTLAKLTPRDRVKSLFTTVVQRVLEASQQEGSDKSEKMSSLLNLGCALVASNTLDESDTTLLFRAIKPLVRNDETSPQVQKRVYKILSELFVSYPGFAKEKEQIKDLLNMLVATSSVVHVSARFMRIKCIIRFVDACSKTQMEGINLISVFLGESLLYLKDSNVRTRDAAYTLLFALARVQGNMVGFIQVILAAIASRTSHMRSAGVMALARIMFENGKNDPQVSEVLPSLLTTVLLLSDDQSREVTKSFIVFIRIAVTTMSPHQLEPLLPGVLDSLLKYHRGKDRFRSKIKIILKKLARSFGYDKLIELAPEHDSKLLTHMRKLSNREQRQKQRRRGQNRGFEDMMDSDEEDSVDMKTQFSTMRSTMKRNEKSVARDAFTQRSKFTQRSQGTTVKIVNDTGGDNFDMADLTKKVTTFAPDTFGGSDSDDNIEFDASGKLLVRDDFSGSMTMNMGMETMHSTKAADTLIPRTSTSTKNESNTVLSKNKKKQTRGGFGRQYKSKKAGGDVKKKGQKYDPYAFVPLDGRQYTKKNRRRAVEDMSEVVRRDKKRARR